MSFERTGASALDYDSCQYGASRLVFRGPKQSLDGPYMAFLGGTETFGRCVPEPYPSLLETETGCVCLNLGLANAGLDAFVTDPEVPHLLAGARLSVIQVLGAQNMSNRFYRVHPRRNDRFLTASPTLTAIFKEIDFTEFTFNRHMLQALQTASPDRFELVRDELKTAWVARMRTLLGMLNNPVVLLWIEVATEDPLGGDPLMVSADMIAEIRDLVRDVVQIRASPAGAANDLEGMVIGSTEWPAAGHLLGSQAHAAIARALLPAVT